MQKMIRPDVMSCEGFVIDASRDDSSDSSDSEEFEIPSFKLSAFSKYNSIECVTSSKRDDSVKSPLKGADDFYVNVYPDSQNTQEHIAHQREILKPSLKETAKKMVTKGGFETLEQVPTFLSRRQKKKRGLKEKEKTKGFGWYNMKAPEMTEETKNDLTVVQMRKALDPKHFYKRSASRPDANPKYFEVGTYEESPLDFYSSRLPKKQRKRTLVEELMADAEFRSYQKKKMSEILKMQPPKYKKVKSKTNKKKELTKEGPKKPDKKHKKK